MLKVAQPPEQRQAAGGARFKAYVIEEKIPSYIYRSEVVVGAELPPTGVTYYEVPKEYGVTE